MLHEEFTWKNLHGRGGMRQLQPDISITRAFLNQLGSLEIRSKSSGSVYFGTGIALTVQEPLRIWDSYSN